MGGRIESSDKFAADIGDGLGPGSLFSQENGYTVVISGGSVLPRHGGKEQFTQSKVDEENMPRNADGAPVHYVPLNVGEGDRKVRFSGLENYGTDDIWSDAYGNVHLWLPSGVQPPTPILMMSAKGGGTPEKPLYDFMANGYRCTVEADANDGLVAKSEEMKCTELAIDGFEVVDGVLRLNLSAEPATWMSGFFDRVMLRASSSLPVENTDETLVDMSKAEFTVEGDGSMTCTVPLPVPPGGDTGSMFYSAWIAEP